MHIHNTENIPYLHTMNPPLVSRAFRYLNWPRNKQSFPFLVFVTIKSLSILCTKKTNIRVSSHFYTPNCCIFFYIYEKTKKRRITLIWKVSCTDMKFNTKTSFIVGDIMYLKVYYNCYCTILINSKKGNNNSHPWAWHNYHEFCTISSHWIKAKNQALV